MNRQNNLRQVFLGLLVCLYSIAALAEENTCQPPIAPLLPATVSDPSQLDVLNSKVAQYSADSARHLACLAAFADRNQDVLTEQQKAGLTSQYRLYLQTAQSHAAQWQGIYKAYVAAH